jgi:anti-sigma factor RsiW
MNCESARLFLDAHFDGELDAPEALRLEEHLAGCPVCSELRRENQVLRSALRQTDVRYRPGPDLDRKIHRALVAQSGFQVRETAKWFAAAAAIVVCAAGGFFLLRQGGVSRQESIAAQVLASHIRSLQPGHLTDVISTDRHTVKPWFQGKLDFAPPVPELPSEDWTLICGRLDYVDQRPVAALVYGWRKHTVNAFVWPGAEGGSLAEETLQGYHLLHFSREGMTWWVVSDLNEAELREFSKALR